MATNTAPETVATPSVADLIAARAANPSQGGKANDGRIRVTPDVDYDNTYRVLKGLAILSGQPFTKLMGDALDEFAAKFPEELREKAIAAFNSKKN